MGSQEVLNQVMIPVISEHPCHCVTGTGSQEVMNQVMIPVISEHLCHCVTGTGSQEVLNQVTVPVISDAVCSKPGWYYNDFIPQKTFCAGYEEGQKDACAVRHYTCRP